MKIIITRQEFLACDNVNELLDGKGIDTSRPFAVRGSYGGGDFVATQGDAKKERPSGYVFGYCYTCKDVTEMAGESCSECFSFIGGK